MSKPNDAEGPVRPRLIFLTQWFDPEPTFKGALFANALADRGYEVEVVTGFPNYPGGKLYDGFRLRLFQREKHGSADVMRVYLYPSHSQSALGRACNYLSFMLTAFCYIAFGARRADVIYCYHPPMTVGLAAAFAGFLRRTPFVIDIQDMWPDTLAATGMVGQSRILRWIGGLCNWVYGRAAHVVVLSPGFATSLSKKSVPESKVSVIYNWADAAAAAGAPAVSRNSESRTDRFQILFAGNMGRAQGLDTVLDAAKIVESQRGTQLDFALIGGGVETDRLKQRVAAENISNVRFLPRVPMAEIGGYLQAADCLLVCLRDDPLFRITVPSKTQAYMAAGKPILMGVAGDAADLVKRSGCGHVCLPEDATALAEAAMKLASMEPADLAAMGQAGRRFYDRHLSIEVGVSAFVKIFENVIRTSKASR